MRSLFAGNRRSVVRHDPPYPLGERSAITTTASGFFAGYGIGRSKPEAVKLTAITAIEASDGSWRAGCAAGRADNATNPYLCMTRSCRASIVLQAD